MFRNYVIFKINSDLSALYKSPSKHIDRKIIGCMMLSVYGILKVAVKYILEETMPRNTFCHLEYPLQTFSKKGNLPLLGLPAAYHYTLFLSPRENLRVSSSDNECMGFPRRRCSPLTLKEFWIVIKIA